MTAATLEVMQRHTTSQQKRTSSLMKYFRLSTVLGVLASLHQKLGLKPSRAPPTHTHTISTVQSQHALAQHWVITLTAVKQKRWKERQRAWISAMSFLVVS